MLPIPPDVRAWLLRPLFLTHVANSGQQGTGQPILQRTGKSPLICGATSPTPALLRQTEAVSTPSSRLGPQGGLWTLGHDQSKSSFLSASFSSLVRQSLDTWGHPGVAGSPGLHKHIRHGVSSPSVLPGEALNAITC